MTVPALDRATRPLLPLAIALLLFAAIVRFAGLGVEPLDPGEASQSIAGWWTVKPAGEQIDRLAPRPESALLLGFDAALFWVLDEATDAGARVIPALAGLAAIALALAWRRPGAGA